MNIFVIADAGDDDVGVCRSEGGGFCNCGRLAERLLSCLPTGGFCMGPVICRDAVSGAEQMASHRPAHYAQPDESDILLANHPVGMRQDAL